MNILKKETLLRSAYLNEMGIKYKYCPTCGNIFIPNNKNGIYCSKECSKYRFGTGICKYCGDEFFKLSKNAKFCSDDCEEKHSKGIKRIKYGIRRKHFIRDLTSGKEIEVLKKR